LERCWIAHVMLYMQGHFVYREIPLSCLLGIRQDQHACCVMINNYFCIFTFNKATITGIFLFHLDPHCCLPDINLVLFIFICVFYNNIKCIWGVQKNNMRAMFLNVLKPGINSMRYDVLEKEILYVTVKQQVELFRE